MTDNQITEAATQIFDACVNPLVSIMCNLLAMQVRKDLISKSEAKWLIASSVDVLNQADVSEEIRKVGGDMLKRMIKAIDQL